MALVLLTAPAGKQGAIIVFGSAQRFGVPMGYGGPHAAFFAAKDEFKRSCRAVLSKYQVHGEAALRMAMQTREQRAIRRESELQHLYLAGTAAAAIAQSVCVYHGPG